MARKKTIFRSYAWLLSLSVLLHKEVHPVKLLKLILGMQYPAGTAEKLVELLLLGVLPVAQVEELEPHPVKSAANALAI